MGSGDTQPGTAPCCEGDKPAKLDCVFCERIRQGEYLGHPRRVVSFEPLNPVTPGHRLFLHQLHTINAGIDPWITAQVFEIASQYGWAQCEDFNLITSVGADATQTVNHLHVHYVPRRLGDGLHLPWTGQLSVGR